jgi:uncharacterized protein YhfF
MRERVDHLRSLELGAANGRRDELIQGVLDGRVTGTAVPFASYGVAYEEVEKIGELLAVTRDGERQGVVEVTDVVLHQLKDVPDEVVAREAGDQPADQWREQRARDWDEAGTPSADTSEIVCVAFRLLDADDVERVLADRDEDAVAQSDAEEQARRRGQESLREGGEVPTAPLNG